MSYKLEECKAISNSNNKLVNGVEADGEAGGSTWALEQHVREN